MTLDDYLPRSFGNHLANSFKQFDEFRARLGRPDGEHTEVLVVGKADQGSLTFSRHRNLTGGFLKSCPLSLGKDFRKTGDQYLGAAFREVFFVSALTVSGTNDRFCLDFSDHLG